jgi:hypothetical protein
LDACAEGAVEGEDDAGVNDGLLIPSAGIGAGLGVLAGLALSLSASPVASLFPLAPLASARGVACVRDAPAPVDPERELPDLVRDDDIELLSVTAPSPSASGSESRNCGAVMNGDCVVDPASSTPSSSVPNVSLCAFC